MHDSGMKVSIIVPTFNRAQYLGECLDSLLAQRVSVGEIIVVNDGSTDGTRDVLGLYGDRIKVVNKEENGGKASALNLGLSIARGEWIWIFDDDDIAFPDALERHLEAIRNRPEADFTYSGYYSGRSEPGAREVEILRRCEPFRGGTGSLFWDLAIGDTKEGIGFMHQQGMLVRGACFKELGPFDGSLECGEDLDMNLRLSRRFKGVPVPEPTFMIRRHDGVRGPLLDRHRASDRETKWAGIGERATRKAYLEGDLPDFDRGDWEERGGRVPALLSRVEVMARWGHADLVHEDLDLLADALRAGGLPPEEWVVDRLMDIELRCRKAGWNGVACDVRRFRDGMVAFRRRLWGVPPKRYYWDLRESARQGRIRLAAASSWGIVREVARAAWPLRGGAGGNRGRRSPMRDAARDQA